MISKVIIAHLYQPGTASTNRIIAYAKSFKSLGMEVVLVLGGKSILYLPSFNGIDVLLATAPFHLMVFSKMAAIVKKIYSRDSCILVYGSPVLCGFLPCKKFSIFYECTEVPFYGKKKNMVSCIIEKVKLVLARQSTGMLVISKALKEYFLQRGIINIEVVNMFVDSTRFDIHVNYVGKKYIAYCGTISLFKDGVDCLIKAFASFYHNHSDYQLIIIGKFENAESERMVKELTEELGLLGCVDFTGMVMPDKMPQLLKGAAMLALARPNNRQAQFGFPTKLGEYLATGKPVVVTNVGEIGSFLQDGVNCRIAKPGDVDDFAEKMTWVANHPEEAIAMGRRGKELTMNEFSAIVQSKKALDFITTVVCNEYKK